VRYYWGRPEVQASLNRLLDNLTRKPLPLSLLSQFLPRQFRLIREGELSNEPQVLVMDKIGEVLEVYRSACGFIG
jgi:D-tagatose-1,6-bisphosphate aldolase subunit GatZ/KbaZ